MSYQSEAVLEQNLLKLLSRNGYELVNINSEEDLKNNFRKQISKFNEDKLKGKPLTDKEFQIIMNRIEGKGVFESAKILRDKLEIERENGERLFLTIMDTQKWCKNLFQVTNQVTVRGKYENRYDVTILINGLPLVQIELKRRGLDMKEAFNQICRYKVQSYTGLFRYIQIFVVSNGVDTKYFANSDGNLNYKYTFFWTDKENNRITNLKDFSTTFLEKCHISKMIARYMVLKETEKQLLVLRPYQVYAVEEIVKRALETNNNGYIWHTTGSGKTLTSFKASQILSNEESIDKVFFLVDRQDLDHQTEKEFNDFQPGSVDRTDSTENLVKQIKDIMNPIIVTTIQKMSNAIKNPKYKDIMEPYRNKKVIFIIDECHRSQFGKMHTAIKEHFQNSQYFGFTGTPRLPENKSEDDRTTADLFDKCLHYYLIKDAIHDGNVLGFSVTYVNTLGAKLDEIAAEKVQAINTEEVWQAEERIDLVARHIIQYHDQRSRSKGYNAIFATDSVESLVKYYDKFKELDHDFKIASIFSYEENPDLSEGKVHGRDSLERMINDYNEMFNTNFSTDNYDGYRADVDKKVREAKIDILLVVNMFLTGFDSKKLNTLYVDKNLKYHNLLQAYSRTNRLDSDKKPYGNIVCFRNLKEATDEALRTFSKTDDIDSVLAKSFDEYLALFKEQVNALLSIAPTPESIDSMESEEKQKEFVVVFRDLTKTLIRMENFNEFEFTEEKIGMDIQDYQDYRSKYLLIKENHDKNKIEKVSILDDIDFALEIMHRDKINVDYIMNLIREIDLENEEKRKEDINYIIKELDRADSIELRNKVELIKEFLDKVVPKLDSEDSIDNAFTEFEIERKERVINDFAVKNRLPEEQVEGLIQEYEFSGIIDKEEISDTLTEAKYSFLENVEKTQELEIFIREVAEEYK
ncbi:type I restriction endonuclease subunit R [Anaerosalibacter bizertensis]|uniref:Type I restriction enzyme endonuclease subunit n=1 Tax=Anaerosalibacter bizertensis TaxID=932217 RepID=A0A844FGD4_9FIRM|nr:type I restriction endonuclease subunit R [Anaerosalibacter bizertensis]MSS43028.1 type I restriction endonuclease subunit R [Anaerosalibacter bizertensis]